MIPKVIYKHLARWAAKRFIAGKATESQRDLSTGGWEVLFGSAKANKDDIFNAPTTAEAEAIYKNMSVIYACVRKVYLAAQEGELTLQRMSADGKTFKQVNNHAALEHMQQPNELMTEEEFLAHILLHFILTGRTYIWKVRGKGMQVTESIPLPTSWVRVENGAFSVWNGQKGRIPVLPMDMGFGSMPDPGNPRGFTGPLQASHRDWQMDLKRENYLGEMLTNIHTPGMILRQPEAWDQRQKDDARALLSDLIGPGHRGSPLFLEGEGSGVEFPAPLKDLDWPGLTSLNETRICSVLGVPPIIIGLRAGLEHATYANYAEADRAFYRQTMVPTWKVIASIYTQIYITAEQGDDRLFFWYDTTDVQQLQEDQGERTTRADKLFAGSLSTRDESREIAGLDPVGEPRGNVFLVPINMMEVPLKGGAALIAGDHQLELESDDDFGTEVPLDSDSAE